MLTADDDDDNNGIKDIHEDKNNNQMYDYLEMKDSDRDGVPDYLDTDDDNDGKADTKDKDDDGDGKLILQCFLWSSYRAMNVASNSNIVCVLWHTSTYAFSVSK